MPVVRIIPERTVDAWTSSAIVRRAPGALIWAPTPPAQAAAGTQPWDFAIEAFGPPGKLLVLENKALIGQPTPNYVPKVRLEIDQLARLIDLEAVGLPIFYGLPGLIEADLPRPMPPENFAARAMLRLRPRFDRWQRMVRPAELFGLRQVTQAIVAHRRTTTLHTSALFHFPSLRQLLADALACQQGKNLPEDPEGRRRPILPPFKPDSIVKDAVRRLAGMGEASPSEVIRRLHEIYSQPDVRARIADLQAEPARVEVHLNRTIWLVLPLPQRTPERYSDLGAE